MALIFRVNKLRLVGFLKVESYDLSEKRLSCSVIESFGHFSVRVTIRFAKFEICLSIQASGQQHFGLLFLQTIPLG